MPRVWVFSASEVAPTIDIIASDDVFFIEYLFGETNIANIRRKPPLGAPDYISVWVHGSDQNFLRTVFHSMLQILSCPPPRGYNETCIFREEFDEMRRSPESLRARISSRVRVMCTSHCLIW